jgi:hypothetical protein
VDDANGAMEAFLARVARHDPAPGDPVLRLEVGSGPARRTYALSPRAARAFAAALSAWRDPDDAGDCRSCGGPLDRDLHCPACGRVDGVFGEALAAFARRRSAEGG